MPYDENKVAIVIPLYNDEANIGRALESAVSQTLPEGILLEILVVDDCSQDAGPQIAEDYARRFMNVRCLHMDRNGGPAAARNRALLDTDAGWFTPFDSDDIMLPDRISRLLEKARQDNLDIVADNLLVSSSSAPETVVRNLWPDKPGGDVALSLELFVARSHSVETERSELGFLKPLIRRRAIAAGPQAYKNALRFGEDFELYARMLADGARAALVDPEGYLLVVREGSASHRQGADDHRKLALIGRQFLQRSDLSPAEREAILTYVRYCEREWASWTAIDAVRSKKPFRLLKAFSISVPASVHVFGQLSGAVGARLQKILRPAKSAM